MISTTIEGLGWRGGAFCRESRRGVLHGFLEEEGAGILGILCVSGALFLAHHFCLAFVLAAAAATT